MKRVLILWMLRLSWWAVLSQPGLAQIAHQSGFGEDLPSAPQPQGSVSLINTPTAIDTRLAQVRRRRNRRRWLRAAGLHDLILPKVAEAGNMIDGIRKSSFSTNERITECKDVTTYNNYYEFSSDKNGSAALARDFRTRLPDMLIPLLLNCSEIDSRSYPEDQVLIG
jgi:hypothetical protein